MNSTGEPIPISLVAHYVFCPRRAWLEAMGERTDTAQMAVGTSAHSACDDDSTSRTRRLRAVDVGSERLSVVGRCDQVGIDEAGRATVVEFKATPVRRKPDVTEPMMVQLALQAQCLKDQGVEVAGAAVYFTEHRVRVPVLVGQTQVDRANEFLAATALMLEKDQAPNPLEDDPKCRGCSHAGVCLPDERRLKPVTRRVLVADPDSQVLHVATPGARAFLRAGRVRVEKGGDLLGSMPLERIQGLVAHGNTDLSSALIREMLWRRQSIVWCSGSGRVVGWSVSCSNPNGGSRVRQHVASQCGHLRLAREFVSAKTNNQATMLRRLGEARLAVSRIRECSAAARRANSVTELFGIEGDAAAAYFSVFDSMLSERVRASGVLFESRTRRPARDPINCALNFVYGLLLSDVIRAVVACGLDPHAGFLHASSRNKPALALDLCEEFRAPVADSVVVGAFNNGEVDGRGFVTIEGAVRLRDNTRKALIAAYERRTSILFTHPLFGYQLTWRRAMEVQARLVLGVLEGTQAAYQGIRVR